MTDTEISITLDHKHIARRSANKWAVQRRQPDGSWDLLKAWTGGRRSLLQFCDEQGIVPTRDAEAALGSIAESSGFRERG